MSKHAMSKFFISIVLPALLAIVLFIISFYVVLIPMFEKSMMERKKEMILELVNTAWSVLDENNEGYESGLLSLDEAQRNALLQIEKMRYGNERKDYFWLIDHRPVMIMHPYRTELNNTDLSGYRDSHGNRLFVDAVRVVDSLGQGFLEYYWQWKDDDSRDVPKLSFVKEFRPWGWIVGTGIYLEDVREEIAGMKQRLLRISGLIVGVILLILAYLVRQSTLIENQRRKAEESLKLSRLKYKSLVEASTEGTIMFVDGKVVFANQKFVEKYHPGSHSLVGLTFSQLFTADVDSIIRNMEDADRSLSIETQTIAEGSKTEVVISLSKISYSDKQGFIVVVKDVSPRQEIELSSRKLSDEVESSLQLMHQSIGPYIKDVLYCELDTPVGEAASLMHRKDKQAIFIRSGQQVIGVVTAGDLISRVLAAGGSLSEAISGVMTSPVPGISSGAMMYEALLRFKDGNVAHLLVKDSAGRVLGVLSYRDCLEAQLNSISYLIEQIRGSERVKQLQSLYARLPILISALASSGDNIGHLTHLITAVSDAISLRVIRMGIEQVGPPPCKFAFISMGSEGRSEQTLKTDQDNAIIYEDGVADVEGYFLSLAQYINDNLHTIGYNNCKGGIMARNPKWCKPLRDWKDYFTRWVNDQDPENILNSQIFFDLRFIYGQEDMVNELRAHFTRQARENSLFLYHMANATTRYRPEIEHNIIDLKKIMLPIISYLRIKALHKGIGETNSMRRLDRLYEQGVVDKEVRVEIEQSYAFLMNLRIKLQSRQLLNNEPPGNEVHEEALSSIELMIIRKILKQVHSLQSELGVTYKGELH